MKPKTPVSKSFGITSPNTSSVEASKQQQSAVADARSKFEQVLRASAQPAAAAALAGCGTDLTDCDKKLLTTADAVAAHCWQDSENGQMPVSSLPYSRLVYMLFSLTDTISS